MEARKFQKCSYGVMDEFVFVKDGKNKYEFYIFEEPGSMYEPHYVKLNGEKVAKGHNPVIRMYREFKLHDIPVERSFYASEHYDDEDEGEAAEEAFDAAFDAAKEWLYA